jgi:putative flippase GtrA
MKNAYSPLLNNKQKEFAQVIRFLVVGVVSAIFDMLLFVLLYEYFQINYLVANFGSTCLAILLNYYISKKWVFSTGKYSARAEFVAFMVFSGIGVVLNQILIWSFVEHLFLDPKVSKFLAIGIVAFFNFVTKKLFVFKG